MRRIARILNLSRTTVARKLIFLGGEAERKARARNLERPPANHIQFDDMETFVHTKLKPLSITLAVVHSERRLLGAEVSEIPASGLLASKSRKKYGPRRDGRAQARDRLFASITPMVAPDALIESDMNPHYGHSVRKYFPKANYRVHRGRKGSVTGQGELKKIGFDPLYSLNHTCAMKRAFISRLVRKTWNTTKIPGKLALHLAIYIEYHNKELIKDVRGPQKWASYGQVKASPVTAVPYADHCPTTT